MFRVYFISSVNFVPHFGHPKVYETSVWTHCFQILAKTMLHCQLLKNARLPNYLLTDPTISISIVITVT